MGIPARLYGGYTERTTHVFTNWIRRDAGVLYIKVLSRDNAGQIYFDDFVRPDIGQLWPYGLALVPVVEWA